MSNAQNLAYTVAQVLHNFGAVATVGGSLGGVVTADAEPRRRLAYIALAGWATQAASGAGLGLVSYFFSHQFPDIAGVAVVALLVKIFCAVSGFLLLASYLLRGSGATEATKNLVWYATSTLSVIALSAAAFLRWYS